MELEIWDKNFSLQWDGVYHLALANYPTIQDWELEKIAAFFAYERLNGRKTKLECQDETISNQLSALDHLPSQIYPFTPSSKIVASTYDSLGNYIFSDFLSHTCTTKSAQEIFKSGHLLSAVHAFKQTPDELVRNIRNAAGDPEDYFNYVMLAWSNTSSGYRLAMERFLGRMPNDEDLEKGFVPGVSFHFRYEDIIKSDGYVFDGYHPAKIKDVLTFEKLFACIIPMSEREHFECLIPEELVPKIHYLDYHKEGLVRWSDRVYKFVESLDDVLGSK